MAPSPRPESPRRSIAITVIIACLAAAGGLAAWLTVRSDDSPDFCRELAQNGRIQDALSDSGGAETDCAALGRSIKKATTGATPQKHSIEQAWAMKRSLLAIAETMDSTGAKSFDASLSAPLTSALADYSEDIFGVLNLSDGYGRGMGPSDPPWEDNGGIHVAVPQKNIMRVLRGVSSSPAQYSELRLSVTRQAARYLATTPDTKEHNIIAAGPKVIGAVLGGFDAVADDAIGGFDENDSTRWQEKALKGLTEGAPRTAPSYKKDPEGNIVTTWQLHLAATKPSGVIPAIRNQAPDMTKGWGSGAHLGKRTIDSLSIDARESAMNSRNLRAKDLG
ncbi:MAG: hypothetical protein LBV60_11085 [Streptomyces sp.]|jgi:hypothetical protein|nr:hypothetical protein [Streptomyces sp.]